MKQILHSLGALFATTTPLITTLSCSITNDNWTAKELNDLQNFEINVAKDENKTVQLSQVEIGKIEKEYTDHHQGFMVFTLSYNDAIVTKVREKIEPILIKLIKVAFANITDGTKYEIKFKAINAQVKEKTFEFESLSYEGEWMKQPSGGEKVGSGIFILDLITQIT